MKGNIEFFILVYSSTVYLLLHVQRMGWNHPVPLRVSTSEQESAESSTGQRKSTAKSVQDLPANKRGTRMSANAKETSPCVRLISDQNKNGRQQLQITFNKWTLGLHSASAFAASPLTRTTAFSGCNWNLLSLCPDHIRHLNLKDQCLCHYAYSCEYLLYCSLPCPDIRRPPIRCMRLPHWSVRTSSRASVLLISKC